MSVWEDDSQELVATAATVAAASHSDPEQENEPQSDIKCPWEIGAAAPPAGERWYGCPLTLNNCLAKTFVLNCKNSVKLSDRKQKQGIFNKYTNSIPNDGVITSSQLGELMMQQRKVDLFLKVYMHLKYPRRCWKVQLIHCLFVSTRLKLKTWSELVCLANDDIDLWFASKYNNKYVVSLSTFGIILHWH